MDFARQQRDPKKHLLGISVVLLLHLLVIYALVTGLARKAVEVIKKPFDAKIIEEVKLPPPPPPPPPPQVKQIERQQPRLDTPPPKPFVPPPEVDVPQAQTAPVISATTAEPPTQPHVIEPPAPPAPPAPPVHKPSVIRGVNCPGQPAKPDYPRNAMRESISGSIFIRATVNTDGSVSNPRIAKVEGMSQNDARKYFSSTLFANATQYSCGEQDSPVDVEIEYRFTLE